MYYSVSLDKLHREHYFSVLQYLSLAPFPLLSKQRPGNLAVLMVPEPHDPDLPAAARVKRDICFSMHACECPTCTAGAVSGGNCSV